MFRNRFSLILFPLLIWAGFSAVEAQDSYMVPSQELVDLVEGARSPSVSISPDRMILLLQDVPALPSIEEIAQPELRLAGIRINPNTNGPSRPGYVTGFTIRDLNSAEDKEVTGLPENARITNTSWSPDGSHFAFLLMTENSLELWVAEISSASARKLSEGSINNTYYGSPFSWTRDGESILVQMVPENRGDVPGRSTVPTGPVIQENIGDARPARTYQDLLQDGHDEDLFEYYFTSQLMEISLNGNHKAIG